MMSIEKVEKPWGFEEIYAKTPYYVGKILNINPNHQLSRQYHKVKTETIRVLSGVLTLTISHNAATDELRTLQVGDVYHIEPFTIHRMSNLWTEVCQILEISTPELDDVVRLEDDYART